MVDGDRCQNKPAYAEIFRRQRNECHTYWSVERERAIVSFRVRYLESDVVYIPAMRQPVS